MLSLEDVKRNIGKKAATLVQEGMVVGLGTGTTAKEVIAALGARIKTGLNIRVVATSKASEVQAREAGFVFADIDMITHIDMTLDGADEIRPDKVMIKGRGGALLREKIIATMSREMVVLVDETKLSKKLGKAMLPVEVIPFARGATLAHIEKLGYRGAFRKEGKKLYMTDSGHLIIDIEKISDEPIETQHAKLVGIPGVVETGFFFGLPVRVIAGYMSGEISNPY